MKKIFIILSIFAILPCRLVASSPYSVSLHVGYAHNPIYGSYANFDVESYMPINKYFEAEANIRTSTANVHTVGLQMRPKFPLPVGELYIDYRALLNMVQRDDFLDFAHAISGGYRMQYVDVQVGTFSRTMVAMPYNAHIGDEMVCEPFNLMYRVEAYVRPETSPWNISLSLANFDTYQMERMWQPMFYLGGWYDVNDNWRVSINGKLKLAGMFHLNAHNFAAEIRAGVEYKF